MHPNTVIFTAVPFYLSSDFRSLPFVALLTGMSVSHTFHDFLPAFFISAPDAESALSSISASRMVENGQGLEAFSYTVFGGFFSLLPVSAISILSFFLLEGFYSFISGFMGFLLLFFLFFLVLDHEEPRVSGLIAVFSGALGLLSFRAPVNQSFVFIPLFSGLFAVPAIISSLRSDFSIPEQDEPDPDYLPALKGSFFGTVSGFIAGVVPGIGAAVSTAFVSPLMDRSQKKFLSSMGAVNTTDIVFSLVALQVLGRARSGASVALEMIGGGFDLGLLGSLSVASVLISAPLALKVSGSYTRLLRSLELDRVLAGVLAFLSCVTFAMTGVPGLLVLFTASLIGIAALKSGSRRACMAVLLVPSILFFLDFAIFM